MKKTTRLTILFTLILGLTFSLTLASPALAQGENPPEINGDQVVIGNAFRLLENQKLNGDLAVMGGTAALEANSIVNGNVAVLGGSLQVDGKVNGDIVAVGGQVSLSDTAEVNGNLLVPVALLSMADGAVVSGDVITQPNQGWDYVPDVETPAAPDTSSGASFVVKKGLSLLGRFLWGMLATVAMGALALLFVLIFPAPIERVSQTISVQPVLSGAVGLLTIFLTPFALLMLIITIILSPFAVLGVILLVITMLVGWIGLGMEVGNRMAAMFHAHWAPGVTALAGVALITFITALFNLLWFCGTLVGIILGMIGLGAVVLTRFGFKEYPPRMVPPAVQPVAAPAPVEPPQPPSPAEPADQS